MKQLSLDDVGTKLSTEEWFGLSSKWTPIDHATILMAVKGPSGATLYLTDRYYSITDSRNDDKLPGIDHQCAALRLFMDLERRAIDNRSKE